MNDRVKQMVFADIYKMYVAKAERKGRTQAEVDNIICWLLGYDEILLKAQIEKRINLETFFDNAPQINEKMDLIKGSICGCKIDEITDLFMKKVRRMDKVIDELAKGKSLEKIKRCD